MRIRLPMLLIALALPGVSFANPGASQGQQPPQQGQGQAPGQGGQGRVPPPEAFAACDGKQAGAVVTFTTPRGEKLTGTCRMFPARLVAMPDHPPQGGNGGPQGGPPNGRPGQ